MVQRPISPASDLLGHEHPVRLDHLGIAAPDLDSGSAPYLALGLTPEGDDELVEAQGVWVRMFRAGDTLIEVLAPAREDCALARSLASRGPGLHHSAYRVPDLNAEVARLRDLGAAFLTPEPGPGRHGTRVIFLHPRWGGGTLIELVEAPQTDSQPGPQPTPQPGPGH